MKKSSLQRLLLTLCLLVAICAGMWSDNIAFTIRTITRGTFQFAFSQSPSLTIEGESMVITTNDSDEPYRFAFNEVLSYVPGDVDDNGKLADDDLVDIISHILGSTPSPFSTIAADYNFDNNVDIADVGGVNDELVGREQIDYIPTGMDVLSASDQHVNIGSTTSLDLFLANPDSVKGLQFDILYPAAFTLDKSVGGNAHFVLAERAGKFIVNYREIDGGHLRVVAYSRDGSAMTGVEGLLLQVYFKVPEQTEWGTYDIALSNVILNTRGNEKVALEGQTTTWTVAKYVKETMNLNKGWNWVSFAVNDATVLSQLKALTGCGIRAIVSREQIISYDSNTEQWYGDLSDLNPQLGYKVYMEQPGSITMEGAGYELGKTPIRLQHGWNWIAYLPFVNQNAGDALKGFDAINGDVLKSQSGASVMYAGGWVGSFAMEKGQSYHYYSKAQDDRNLFYYHEQGGDTTIVTPGGHDSEYIDVGGSQDGFDVKAFTASYSCDNTEFDTEQIMYIKIRHDGLPMTDLSNCSLSAWIGTECRGIAAEPLHVGDCDVFAIRVWSDAKNDQDIKFRLTDDSQGREYELKEMNATAFVANSIGMLNRPSEYFIFDHAQTDLTINVTTPGTLAQEIFAHSGDFNLVDKLTVVGEVNAEDVQFLSQLQNITVLNLGRMKGASEYLALGGLEQLQTVVYPEDMTTLTLQNMPGTSLSDVTMMAFFPPVVVGEGKLDVTLHTTEFSRQQYVKAGWDKYFTKISGDVKEPEERTIVVHQEGSTLTYTDKMAAASFAPSIAWRRGQTAGTLELYGEQEIPLSKVALYLGTERTRGNAICIPHVNCQVAEADLRVDIRAGQWKFFTPSFNVRVADILPMQQGAWVVKHYSSENRAYGNGATWETVAYADELHKGEGYIIAGKSLQGDSIVSFLLPATSATASQVGSSVGCELSVSDYTSIYTTEKDWNWNFLGNPYPAYYDISKMDYEAPILVWDDVNSTYRAYSPLDDDYSLAPGEAFFVQTNGQTGINFSAAGRQTVAMQTSGFVKNEMSSQSDRRVCNILLSNGAVIDRTRFVINPKAQPCYEIGRDMAKMFSDEAEMQIYLLLDNVKYAICEQPAYPVGAYLGMTIASPGTYLLQVNGYAVCIEDIMTGEVFCLSESNAYSFYTKAGTFQNRFRFVEANATDVESIKSDAEKKNVSAFDLLGRKVNKMQHGVYILNGKKQYIK